MQAEFEARPEVAALPAGYIGDIVTGCHAVRIRNTSQTDALTIDVSGTPFAVAAGTSWGMETGDVRAIIMRPIKLQTGAATALVERIFFSKL